MEIEKAIEDIEFCKKTAEKGCIATVKIESCKLAIKALELLKLKEKGKVIITPCAVGDQIETKYGDTWRVDGFTTYGEEVRVWCEGENEHYAEFSQDEIIKYIPREEENNEME